MSFPAGYSDSFDKTKYSSAFGDPVQGQTQYSSAFGNTAQGQTQYSSAFGNTTPGQTSSAPQQYGGQPITNQPVVQVYSEAMYDPNSPLTNDTPVSMVCPSCHSQITTNTSYSIGTNSWMWCVILAVSGLIPFCWLPLVLSCSKDVVHACPNCKAVCGRCNRMHHDGRLKHHLGTVTNVAARSENSVQMQCPSCKANITTTTRYENGACAWYWCLSLASSGLIPFNFIPFCCKCSQDVVHSCPQCKTVCGRYHRAHNCCKGGHR